MMTTTHRRRVTRLLAPVAVALLLVLTQTGCETNAMLREKGRKEMRAQDYAAAEAQFLKAAERDPSDWRAQYLLGVTRMEQRNYISAQHDFEKALALRNHDSEATPLIVDGIAESLYQQGRIESLYAFLKRVTDTYGTSADYLRQADYLTRAGDLDSATVAYQKAAYFADDKDESVYVAIADFYGSINDVPNATQALRYAYYINPHNPQVESRFRKYGIVPGPTQAEPPPKPEMLR